MKIGKSNVEFLGQKLMKIDKGENINYKFYSLKPIIQSLDCINHHILLIDVSKSLRDEIINLRKTVKETLKALKRSGNNYVSVILYSDESKTTVLADALRCDDSSYRISKIYKKINEEIYARENTVLSKTLEQANKIINELEEENVKNNIIIFTDGNLSNLNDTKNEEKAKCFKLLKTLKNKKVCVNTIGFGVYYDRDFLVEFSEKSFQGRFNHIGNISNYYNMALAEINRVNNSQEVNLEIENDEYFMVDLNKKINDKSVINNLMTNSDNIVVTYSDDLKIEGKEVKSNKKQLKKEYLEDFLYSLALCYLNKNDIEKMEEAIANTKDVFAYESLVNCYSFTEKGKAIELLDLLCTDKSKRFKKGKKVIERDLNEKEGMCLLEILQEIMNDDKCKLLWNYAYKYNRIGVKEKQVEDIYKFKRLSEGFGEVTKISIGSRKLNIGVKVKIKGVVRNEKNKLMMDALIYRDYNLVANGNINTDEIYCKLSKTAKAVLRKEKLIKSVIKIYDEEICVLNIANIKLTNKRTSNLLSEKQIAHYLYDIESLSCDIWALDKILKEVFSSKNKISDDKIDIEELEMRKLFRIDSKNIYKPISVESDTTSEYDFYLAKVIELKVERFPRTKKREESLDNYKTLIRGDFNESHKRILEKLKELKDEKEYKQNLINIVKISNKLREKNIFMWDEITEKEKKETDKYLKKNMVLGEKMKVSTKVIDGIKIREDFYEVLSKYN